jgi:Uma2 family endonuclease
MLMATETKCWTLEELHRLPDDGNKYELVRGELFVTPAPTEAHETIIAQLTSALVPYVAVHGLGLVFHARAVMRHEGSEVEPDLMVRKKRVRDRREWDESPIPILVVEVLSNSTRCHDHGPKRELYLDAGVAEYWIVDPERREVRVVRDGRDDAVVTGALEWHPRGVEEGLSISMDAIFDL